MILRRSEVFNSATHRWNRVGASKYAWKCVEKRLGMRQMLVLTSVWGHCSHTAALYRGTGEEAPVDHMFACSDVP